MVNGVYAQSSGCISHQCVLGAAPQLWDLCGEADERSQSAQQGVQEQRRAARHAHHFLQREEETKHQLLIGGRVGNVVRLWLDRFMFIS